MSPPLFAELAKPSLNIFNNGYPLGQVRVDVGIKTCGNVNISTGGAINTTDWSMDSGAIDCKYNVESPRCKTTVSESWDINNKLRLGVTTDNLLGFLPGCRVNLTETLDPATGKCSTRLNPQLRTHCASMEVAGEIGDDVTTSLSASIVGCYEGWLAGVKGKFNVDNGEVDSHTIGVGYCSPTFQAHAFCDNLENFRVSAYQRVNDRLEIGLKAGYNPASASGGDSKSAPDLGDFAIGGRVLLCPETSLRAKVDANSQLGLGLETQLRQGTTLTLATQIDGKSINGGNHKIGLGIEWTGDFSNNCL